MELPPVPPVMVQGSSVTYTGRAAADVRALIRLGLERLEAQARRVGQPVPERFLLVLHAAEVASADMRTSADVRSEPISPSSSSGTWVGVRDAAGLLGVGERQARRRIELAGGTKTRKGWRVEKEALLADDELRRSA